VCNEVANSSSQIIIAAHRIDHIELGPFDVNAFHHKEEKFEQGLLSHLLIFMFKLVLDLSDEVGLES